ncbi:NUDIX domain-containing protein [Plantactinospora sp. S1510]|uniref:NUDIX domain-containing protein n=1 Tax=Plantactinospora alkalitolerans TaxID=2789879 RepID=A0ABS0GSG2_9ACTN|nr:NUDIX domain-containing protein [Plantactinospora alkalitolerans]MBF9129131.1 NUDIX domain-containing protein [Plantactinospora alkalitolerans]
MDRRRRIGAYGLCRDGDRVLLARGSGNSAFPGLWQVPGGGVEHGEDPAAAVRREFAEETGLTVEVTGLRAVLADVVRLAGVDGPVAEHTDRIVYDVVAPSGISGPDPEGRPPHADPDGGTDAVAWVGPGELAGLALMPFTAELLGRPVDPLPEGVRVPQVGTPVRLASIDRRQRFAAYGLATDPAGRILLARIADGFPGAGRWHLPGGGTDHGEQPVSALLRELVEETGQLGRVTALLHVSHRHNTSEFGPEGRALDWHGVRAIYRVLVDAPTEAKVTEAAGGSTASAGWFPPAEVAVLPRTEVVDAALSLLAP